MREVKVPLTRGKFAVINSDDLELVMGFKWHITNLGYARTDFWKPQRGYIFMHRLIMPCPQGLQVDHINGDRLDNRRENLRICTQAQNVAARLKTKNQTHSKYKGIKRIRTKWSAVLRHRDKDIYLGMYDNELSAAKAYDAKALEIHGEFAKTNKMMGLYE